MTPTLLLAFIGACILLAVTPGPNMALIIASTLTGGFRAGLATLAGTTTGLALLVAVAALGMTSVMVILGDWFDVVRWLGAVYLAVLGARQLRAFQQRRKGMEPAAAAVRPAEVGSLFLRGVLVSLSNPKTLLFLGAFLPQFVDTAHNPAPQLALLAVLFVAILAAVDLGYTIAIARARDSFSAHRLALLEGASGVLLLAGGVMLATLRRP